MNTRIIDPTKVDAPFHRVPHRAPTKQHISPQRQEVLARAFQEARTAIIRGRIERLEAQCDASFLPPVHT